MMQRLTVALALAAEVSATNDEGKAYLEKKGTEKGVVTLPSGLMYKVRIRALAAPPAGAAC